MAPNRVVVRLRPGSDGDATHVPKQGHYTQINPPTLYLEKIADQWMAAKGEGRPGVKYILEGLPVGYTLWQRPRGSNSQHTDKYLYGHPRLKHFDSPNRFYPHFEYLMANSGSNIGCPCTVCSGSSGVLPGVSPNSSRARSASVASRRTTSSNISVPMHHRPKHVTNTIRQVRQVAKLFRVVFPSKFNDWTHIPLIVLGRTLTLYCDDCSVTRVPHSPLMPLPGPVKHAPEHAPIVHKGRPKTISAGLDTSNVDMEGTPDIYRNLIDKLRRYKQIDEIIQEPLSPDWRADQELLPEMLAEIQTKEQWVPRKGDIVLYIRDLPKGVELIRNETTDEIQSHNEDSGEFDTLKWRAGLVTELATGATILNLVEEDISMNVSRSGVRVEPVADPNNPDMSMSKQHKYVSLRQTCPFVLWQELLRHTGKEYWHATIKNALKLSATFAVMGRYRFRGTWPNAHLYCYGMHLGSELLVVGDTIRLLPNSKSEHACTDVMVIKSIRIKFTCLDKASNNDYDDGRPYNTELWVYGSSYTSDPSRSDKQWLSDSNVEPPKGAADYADWHPRHPSDKELAVPFNRVLGRLTERDAMAYFLKSDSEELLDLEVGRRAVMEGRKFSQKHNTRLTQQLNATWFWADHRAEALGLHTMNGLDVAEFDQERDVKDMRKKYQTLDAIANGQVHSDKVRPEGLRDFLAPPNALSRAQSTSTAASSDGEHGNIPKKRALVTDPTDDDDIDSDMDEEIRQHTRVIGINGPTAKKAKVKVVIGRAPPV